MGLPVSHKFNMKWIGPDITCRYAWPPHQIMAWVGLERYGYLEEAQRLAYRWIYMYAHPHRSCAVADSAKQDDYGFC